MAACRLAATLLQRIAWQNDAHRPHRPAAGGGLFWDCNRLECRYTLETQWWKKGLKTLLAGIEPPSGRGLFRHLEIDKGLADRGFSLVLGGCRADFFGIWQHAV
jgi:hypothetical protein